jgi:putative membrane protein
LVSLASGGTSTDPPLYVVFFAAAVAVCALVVPGVSGSFLLLAIGIYTATLDAVSGRDLAYLAVFAAGATCGLASFVQLLGYLLREHRRTTLVVMTGLMVGSLRALWPWQSSSDGHDGGPGALLAPTEPLAGPLMLMVLGVAVVLALVWVQALVEQRESREQAERTSA